MGHGRGAREAANSNEVGGDRDRGRHLTRVDGAGKAAPRASRQGEAGTGRWPRSACSTAGQRENLEHGGGAD
jgi:hypothetical protein